MNKINLADSNGICVNIRNGFDDKPAIITESLLSLNTNWYSSVITTATTTTIAESKPNQSILITDIVIVLSKKVTNATIEVMFDDGSNNVTLFTFDASTSSFQFSHTFRGGIRGWKDADFKIITNQATTVSVLIGYLHISPESSQSYFVWDAGR